MSRPFDYEEEAAIYVDVLDRLSDRPVESVLELGSGGGNNASHMKQAFDMTLVDLSPEMIAVSRDLNPELDHHVGDMASVRLDRTFDAVFIHDAVQYVTTADALQKTFQTAHEHLRPGGVALFVPDDTTETFTCRSWSGGHEEGDRAFRYLAWQLEPEGSTFRVVYAYMMRDDRDIRVEVDTHHLGLFPRASWLEWITDAGFDEVEAIPYEHSSFDPLDDRRMFFGRRRERP